MTITTKVSIPVAELTSQSNARVPRALKAALTIVEQTTRPLTPRLTGALRDSAVIQVTGGSGSLTYTARYAVYQHERMDYQHSEGGPKYLERGLASSAGAAFEAMRRETTW